MTSHWVVTRVVFLAILNGVAAGGLAAQQPSPPRRAPAQQQPARKPATKRPAAPPTKVLTPLEQRIQSVENGLVPAVRIKGKPLTGMTLAARMKKYHVQGVSIAVIKDYAVEWARGYGVADGASGTAVDSATAFQAGAAGQPVAALVALRLSQTRKFDLNRDVNRSLKTWKLPKSDFTKKTQVTVRALLSHSAGLSATTPAGFEPGATLPTITHVLFGIAPALTPAVVSRATPGESTTWASAADYDVMQQLLEDVTKRPFASLADDSVLEPLGMIHSGFVQPPTEPFARRVAAGHDALGKPLAGKWRVYPELAAAGLWTTPSDLAQVIVELQLASGGRPGKVLGPESATLMLTPEHLGWPGLGVMLEGRNESARFRASGVTEGFVTELVGWVERGDGAVVMVNTVGGSALVEEILNAIATTYGWPGYVPPERVVAKVDPKVFDRFVGRYAADAREVSVAKKGARLFIGPAGKETTELLPESVSDFFSADPGAVYSFVFDEGGKVQAFTQREHSGSSRWDRKQ